MALSYPQNDSPCSCMRCITANRYATFLLRHITPPPRHVSGPSRRPWDFARRSRVCEATDVRVDQAALRLSKAGFEFMLASERGDKLANIPRPSSRTCPDPCSRATVPLPCRPLPVVFLLGATPRGCQRRTSLLYLACMIPSPPQPLHTANRHPRCQVRWRAVACGAAPAYTVA